MLHAMLAVILALVVPGAVMGPEQPQPEGKLKSRRRRGTEESIAAVPRRAGRAEPIASAQVLDRL